MRSVQLQETLAAFVAQAAAHLHADVHAGNEVPFELEARSARMRGAALYCYRPLTGAFVAERFAQLRDLDAYAPVLSQLERCDTLERYLLARGVEAPARGERHADAVLLALLQDVFEEQTDFHPGWLEQHPERLERALQRLDGSALPHAGEVTLIATLHGLAICTPEVALAPGLSLAQPDALAGVPEQALPADRGTRCAPRMGHRSPAGGSAERGHLLVVHTAAEPRSGAEGVAEGVAAMRELLRALRLFGDGRIALGARAFARVGEGSWSTIALGAGGHPHGVLLVTPEQEDELRAFCSLVARRRPEAGPVAWALRRFELGCERACEYEALSDHLLALRALLGRQSELELADWSPIGGAPDGLLAGRLAALCATPERRAELAERTLAAIALERAAIAGTAVQRAGRLALVRDLADHLRALLRDVVCGHLRPQLAELADEILLGEQDRDGSLSEQDWDGSLSGPVGEGSLSEQDWDGSLSKPAGEGRLSEPAGNGRLSERDQNEPALEGAGGQLVLSEQELGDEGDPGEVLRVAV